MGEILHRLEEGLGAREPFLTLTGAPGTGKTSLAREAVARWEARAQVAFLAYPVLTGAELLEEIVLRFGGEPEPGISRPRLLKCFEQTIAGIAGRKRVAMILVDDAHKLTRESLEDLRLLVQVAQGAGHAIEALLIGLPSLEANLEDPALESLRGSMSVRVRIGPLSPGESRRYVRHRVAAGDDGAQLFPRKTCAEIASLTEGVPRRINTLASEALRVAREAGEEVVRPEHARAAAESLREPVSPRAIEPPDDDEDAEADAPKAGPKPAESRSPKPEEKRAPKIEEIRVQKPEPKPAQKPAPVTPAPEEDPATLVSRATAPQDPDEWVQRFVGDRGPMQIGSKAPRRQERADDFDALLAGSAAPPGVPGTPGRSIGGRPESRRAGAHGLPMLTSALLVVLVIAMVVLVIRARPTIHGGSLAVGSSTAPVPAQDVSTIAPTPHAGEKPARESRAPADSSRRTDRMASATGRYTLDVGGFFDLRTALDQRDRYERLTGIEGWVIPAPDSSGGPNRIVLGIYTQQRRAEAAAKMLINSQTLNEVRVVPLPKKSFRM